MPPTPAPPRDVLAGPQAGPLALRGGALRTAGYVLGLLLSLASVPILIRHLGIGDFGRYTTIVALIAIVAGLTEGGVSALVQREYASVDGPLRDLVLRQLLGVRVALTLAGVAAALLFAMAAGYQQALIVGTLVAGVGLLLATLQALMTSVLQARLRFGWPTAIDLLRQALTVALIVVLAVAGAGLLPFFAVPVAAGLVGLIVSMWLVRGSMPLRPAFLRGEWFPLLRETLPYAVAIALNSTYLRVGMIVMSLLAGSLQTGYYATAFRVVEVLLMVPALAIGAAFPILVRSARDDPERFDFAAGRILELALIAGAWVALSIGLGAQVAIDVLTGGAEPAVEVLQIQGVALMASFVALAGSFTLLALRDHPAILLANGLALVVALVLSLLLVPLLEARGAALAITLAEVTTAVVSLVVVFRARPRLRRVMRALPAVLIALAAGVAVVLIPALPATADVLLGSGLFFAVLAAAGRFPPEVKDALRRPRATRAGP